MYPCLSPQTLQIKGNKQAETSKYMSTEKVELKVEKTLRVDPVLS